MNVAHGVSAGLYGVRMAIPQLEKRSTALGEGLDIASNVLYEFEGLSVVAHSVGRISESKAWDSKQ